MNVHSLLTFFHRGFIYTSDKELKRRIDRSEGEADREREKTIQTE